MGPISFSSQRENSILQHFSGFPPKSTALSLIQSQADQLTQGFVDQAADWKSLTAVMAGGLAYRLGKIGAMTLGAGQISALPLRVLSTAVGLGTEVTGFEFTNRILVVARFPHLQFSGGETPPLQHNGPNLWSWSGPGGWAQGLFSSATTFGLLKGAGHLAQGQNILLQHLFQDAAMVAGRQGLGALGVTPRQEGTIEEQWVHAEATNLQMQAGMGLVQGLFPRLVSLERSFDLSSSLSFKKISSPLPSFAVAMAGEGENQTILLEMKEAREKPLILQMASRKGGGHEWSDSEIHALAERAKTDLSSVCSLLDLARNGNETANRAVKSYQITLYYAEAAKRNHEIKALSTLEILARGGNRWAFTALEKAAQSNDRAVDFLYHLAWEGKEEAFEPLIRLAKTDPRAVYFISAFAREVKIWALDGLTEAAKTNPNALIALFNLARVHNMKEAQARLNVIDVKAIVQRAPTDREAISILRQLAFSGHPSARDGIMRLSRENPAEFEILAILLRPNPIGELIKIAKDPLNQKYLSSLSLLFYLAEDRIPGAVEAILEVGKTYPPNYLLTKLALSHLEYLEKKGVEGASMAFKRLKFFFSEIP